MAAITEPIKIDHEAIKIGLIQNQDQVTPNQDHSLGGRQDQWPRAYRADRMNTRPISRISRHTEPLHVV
jgi:hypothetical protein